MTEKEKPESTDATNDNGMGRFQQLARSLFRVEKKHVEKHEVKKRTLAQRDAGPRPG